MASVAVAIRGVSASPTVVSREAQAEGQATAEQLAGIEAATQTKPLEIDTSSSASSARQPARPGSKAHLDAAIFQENLWKSVFKNKNIVAKVFESRGETSQS